MVKIETKIIKNPYKKSFYDNISSSEITTIIIICENGKT